MIRLENVLKISLQDVLKTSWRCLEDVFQDVLKTFWRRLQNVLKTSWQDVLKTFWRRINWSWPRRLEDALWRRKVKANISVLIKTSWRRPEDVFWRGRWNTSSRCLQDVFMFAGPWLRTCFNAQKLMQTVVIDAFIYLFIFSIWVFFHEHSLFTGQQGKGWVPI